MEFKINQIDFQKVVNGVMPAVGSEGKSDINAFRYIQITALDNTVTFAATNGEVMLKCSVVADVIVKGCIGVTGKALSEVVNLLPSGNISVLLAGEARLQIRAGRSAIHLPVIPGDTFPILPDYENISYTPIEDFFTDFEFVSFAVSKDQTRPQLSGVCLNQEEFAATDGHRLSIRKVGWKSEVSSIMSSDGISKLRKMFPDKTVGIHIGETEAHFSQDGRFATVRLIRGPYVDYAKVIPATEATIANIKVGALKDALKMIMIVADEQNSITLTFGKDTLSVFAESAQKGKAEDILPIICETELRIGMNGAYLKQALENTDADEVVIELRGSNKPLVLRDGKNLHVLMPKRI